MEQLEAVLKPFLGKLFVWSVINMYIGEVSKLTGATPKAIRLYEKLGLIPIPNRKGKYRDFNDIYLELIIIIKKAQRLGFKLSEMKEFFNEGISCDLFPWAKAIMLIQEKAQSLAKEIKQLEDKKVELEEFAHLLKKRECNL